MYNEKGVFVSFIIGLIAPILGLFGYAILIDDKPKKAKSMLFGLFFGFFLNIFVLMSFLNFIHSIRMPY